MGLFHSRWVSLLDRGGWGIEDLPCTEDKMVSDFEGNAGGISPEEEQNSDWGRFSKRLVEGIVPDVMRKTAASALNTFLETEEGVRAILGVVSKEAVGYARDQIDRSRTEIVGLIKREMHEFLARVDVQKELEKVLVNTTLQVNAEIRFVQDEKGELAPKVNVKTVETVAENPKRKTTRTKSKSTRKSPARKNAPKKK
jgi:hypothetical protein